MTLLKRFKNFNLLAKSVYQRLTAYFNKCLKQVCYDNKSDYNVEKNMKEIPLCSSTFLWKLQLYSSRDASELKLKTLEKKFTLNNQEYNDKMQTLMFLNGMAYVTCIQFNHSIQCSTLFQKERWTRKVICAKEPLLDEKRLPRALFIPSVSRKEQDLENVVDFADRVFNVSNYGVFSS